MKKAAVRARIEDIGIIPGIRVATPEHARFAAEAVNRAGIPIAEITMTVPGAINVIAHLASSLPEMVVGAGTVLDVETARRCLDAGATFLTSTGLVPEVVEFALQHEVVVFPGAMTPTDLIAGWKIGADFIKIYPCGPLGGPSYIRALNLPFPQVPLIASGGVNQRTAGDFILNGATALGIGSELINPEGLPVMQEEQIRELARRYLKIVKAARAQKEGE
ncbi:MAG TPA: bifunctional 4-hydroxy-2-oxoglutarate aldolase/2-dehydro-3-deoxy-phosphogluconate aldolase [Bryobacteraceae bacterium]|jgi:2-dehydro-3-deoxyphosphogluconate aldolase/(4S)-4-hydroxy-2-oxoglutarate aldolase|nr:bifunctional 4-hydroxy-2-oxoglutarate aldolase/2-dehydro-3-deoxy-phosphogluconate aldolase [Bryobacteraceae bacterium]